MAPAARLVRTRGAVVLPMEMMPLFRPLPAKVRGLPEMME